MLAEAGWICRNPVQPMLTVAAELVRLALSTVIGISAVIAMTHLSTASAFAGRFWAQSVAHGHGSTRREATQQRS